MNGYSRETFVEADDHTRHGMTYDILEHLYNQGEETKKRVKRLENRRWLHSSLQALGGVVGGAIAVVAYIKLFCP